METTLEAGPLFRQWDCSFRSPFPELLPASSQPVLKREYTIKSRWSGDRKPDRLVISNQEERLEACPDDDFNSPAWEKSASDRLTGENMIFAGEMCYTWCILYSALLLRVECLLEAAQYRRVDW